jgi:hypothetical protein
MRKGVGRGKDACIIDEYIEFSVLFSDSLLRLSIAEILFDLIDL